MRSELPDFRDWSVPAIHLLRGVVYADDGTIWNILLSNKSTLDNYFARIGVRLIVDEGEGLAYLRQQEEHESPPDYQKLPKLFRPSALSYPQTLMCVLLRDELRRFEEEDLQNERCVVRESELLEQWKLFFPSRDDVKLQKDMVAALRALRDLSFVRAFEDAPPSWEVRRILKARLQLADLEQLRARLAEFAQRRGSDES